MIDIQRYNEMLKRRLLEIDSARSSITFFQNIIEDALNKNEESKKIIIQQQELCHRLKQDFLSKNNINFQDAKKLVDNSFNPSKIYNLEDYNEINNIDESISEEKFFIYYRNNIMKKNEAYINEITRWINELEINTEKLKNRIQTN